MAQGELVRVVAYLDAGLAERLAEAARSGDRSVSREVARRLAASFQPAGRALLEPSGPAAVQSAVRAPAVSKMPLPKKDPPALAKTMEAIREKTGECLAFTPRGTRCKVCGKTH